jgi:hypothetical protein
MKLYAALNYLRENCLPFEEAVLVYKWDKTLTNLIYFDGSRYIFLTLPLDQDTDIEDIWLNADEFMSLEAEVIKLRDVPSIFGLTNDEKEAYFWNIQSKR